MTKKEVETHPVFLRLSDNDKKFLLELMENGNDKRAAAHLTWKCKDDASADSMANKALRKPAVKFLTDEYFGVNILRKIPSRDEFTAFAWERAQKAALAGDDASAHKWASTVVTVQGYAFKPQDAPPAEPAAPVDDSNEEFS